MVEVGGSNPPGPTKSMVVVEAAAIAAVALNRGYLRILRRFVEQFETDLIRKSYLLMCLLRLMLYAGCRQTMMEMVCAVKMLSISVRP